MPSKSEAVELNYSVPMRMRAFSAKLFDLFSVLLLSIITYFLTLTIIQNSPPYKRLLQTRENYLVDSALYVKQTDGQIERLDIILKDSDSLTYNEKSARFEDAFATYYTVFLEGELPYSAEEHYSQKKADAKSEDGQTMFSPAGARILTNADYDREYFDFYCLVFEKDAIPLLTAKGGYAQVRREIIIVNTMGIIGTVIAAHMIIYLAIPLILRRGKRTLGMVLTRLSYVSADGFSPTWNRYLGFYFFGLVFEFIASFAAFLVPFMISLGFFMLRKDRQTLADYIAGIYLVDAADRDIYLDVNEYLLKQRKIEDFAESADQIHFKN